MIKKTYREDTDRAELLNGMIALGKILVEEANHIDENYMMFIDPSETEPYIMEPYVPEPPGTPEPTPIELLQEDNASLWYESMIQSTRVEANETEVANLWYELMMGGI